MLIRFTDTVTLAHKNSDDTYTLTVIPNVQWSDKTEKTVNSGRMEIGKYAIITFPLGTYESIDLNPSNEEDAIFYGIIEDEIVDERGKRISDMLKKYPRSGRIKSVNDNSNRIMLKHKKVVIA